MIERMYDRRVPYREFAQQVRRFHRDLLLDMVGQQSARIQSDWVNGVHQRPGDPVRQFTLAAIARTALAEAMVFRAEEPVPYGALEKLCALAIEVDQPDVPGEGVLFSPAMRRLMTRMSYQQHFYYYGDLEDIVRTLSLLVEHDPTVRGLPTSGDWEAVLGVSLPVYMTIVFAVFVGASVRGGRFTDADIAEYAHAGAFGGADAATARMVIDAHLAADLATVQTIAKNDENRGGVAGRELWLSNPLLSTPLITDGTRYRLPISPYLLHKITPLGLFFTGSTHFGDDFPRALGDSFEKHLGPHLKLLEPYGAQVYPEITYGRDNKRTVDYIVVFDAFVLLVEAKGLRSTESARIGDDTGLEILAGRVQRARDQIDRTAGLIAEKIPELARIPADRPVRGLVVTLEPIHLIDTFLFTDLLSAGSVESATASAHDLEQIIPTVITLPNVGERLLQALTFHDPTPASLDRAVKDLPRQRNPLAAAVWDRWSVVKGKSDPAPEAD
ncbi:hypothetical protein [Nocardia sp. NPDC050710]|uniref:hypothetical protein n=1 Tax=Nocardia sp. NPDC050710 TaxID=3157220 RepID=UPI0033E7B000